MPPQEERKRKPVARKTRRVMRAARAAARTPAPDRTARERPAAQKRAPARPKRSVRPATRGVTPPTGRGPSRRMAPTARAKPARPTPARPTHWPRMAPSRAPKPVTSRRPGILQTAPGRRLKPRSRRPKGKTILDRGLIRRGIRRLRRQ